MRRCGPIRGWRWRACRILAGSGVCRFVQLNVCIGDGGGDASLDGDADADAALARRQRATQAGGRAVVTAAMLAHPDKGMQHSWQMVLECIPEDLGLLDV